MAAVSVDPQRPLPVYLVSVRLGIYEDEHHRVWIVANVETSHSSHGNRVSFRAPDRLFPNSYPCELGCVYVFVCVCVVCRYVLLLPCQKIADTGL